MHAFSHILLPLLMSGLTACAPEPSSEPVQAPAPRPFVLVLLGDSLTQGYGLSPQQALPVQLEQRLVVAGAAIEVRNGGVSGETSAQGLLRFDRALPADADGVIIQFGANDMLQGRSPEAVRADLDALILRAKARGLWVGLVGMKAPPIAGRAYRAAFDPIYADLARQHDVPLYPFYYEGLIDAETAAVDAAHFLRDRVHPSAAGVAIVAAGMAVWLQTVLPDRVFAQGQ